MRTFLNIFLDEFTAIPIVHSLCSRQYPTNFKTFCSWAFFSLILPFKHYSRDVKIFVKEISGVTLGRELVRRCGNEGQHRHLDAARYTNTQFLRVAISFVPDALDDGADMCNAAFVLSQPGREFLIQSGSGDWEFYFAEDQYGDIYGRNIRKPFFRYVWDGVKSVVRRIGGLLSIAGSSLRALKGG